ncbi:ABC transporter ATP-binding protein [Thermodesulfobacteriota bacterium]
MGHKLIRVKELTKTFPQAGGEILVLDNLSFKVDEGSFTTLLGPSGCGKSTLLNILTGLESPSSGSIEISYVGGEEVRPGYVFQTARLLPWKSIIDNIIFVHSPDKPRKEIEDVAMNYLKLTKLEQFAHNYPYQLSGGMQQRVGIARALSVEPGVLLMDEPFSHLDEITARQIRTDLINIWQKAKVTIFFITHDLSEATLLSDRIIFMTQKPAQIYKDFSIDLPRPRSEEDQDFFEFHKMLTREFHLMEQRYGETADR